MQFYEKRWVYTTPGYTYWPATNTCSSSLDLTDANACPPYNEAASRATIKVCAPHVASRNGIKPGARHVVPAALRGIKWQAAETLNTQFLQTQLHSNYL